MARQKTVNINGQRYVLQSVSPQWYYDLNDECGMTGGKRKSSKYVDALLKNCVISPAEIKQEGLAYFDDTDDIDTPEKLIQELEAFFREPAGQRSSSAESSTE